MSEGNQETVTDIAKEMREGFNKSWHDVNREWAHGLADRLEAAGKREIGNAAALREAVVLALSLLDLKDGVPYKTVSQKDIDFMKAALSVPPRNCEMADDRRK